LQPEFHPPSPYPSNRKGYQRSGRRIALRIVTMLSIALALLGAWLTIVNTSGAQARSGAPLPPSLAAVPVPMATADRNPASAGAPAIAARSVISQVVMGSYHSCALLTTGAVRCWGDNEYSQLGDGTEDDSNVAVNVTGITNAIAIATGKQHSCVVISGGSVKCWGENVDGGLGDGTRTNRNVPVAVTGITNAISISLGDSQSCALLDGGSIKCWGDNSFGKLGDGTTSDRYTPVLVSGISDAVSIHLDFTYACARRSGGEVMCWGRNNAGQLGDGTQTNRSVPTAVTVVETVKAIDTGSNSACAIKTDDSVVCWGLNDSGQLGNGTQNNSTAAVAVTDLTSGVVAISAGRRRQVLGGRIFWGTRQTWLQMARSNTHETFIRSKTRSQQRRDRRCRARCT